MPAEMMPAVSFAISITVFQAPPTITQEKWFDDPQG
jgi:hypothetical protein